MATPDLHPELNCIAKRLSRANPVNKTDASCDSDDICRVSGISRSPSPEPKRSAKKMKHLCYIIYVGLVLCSCKSTTLPNTNTGSLPSARENVRISDDYKISEVASYEVSGWPVAQHCMAVVTLKSGRNLPMLCRRQSASIYPIPQSVFATEDPRRFSIMCEPLVAKGGVSAYALMHISVVADSSGISDGIRKAPKISPVPKLIERP